MIEPISLAMPEKAHIGSLQGKVFEPASLLRIFTDGVHGNISPYVVFALNFQKIPCVISEGQMDASSAIEWFKIRYRDDIKADWNTRKRFRDGGDLRIDDNFFILFEDLLVSFDVHENLIRLLYNETPVGKVFTLAEQILNFKVREKRGETRLHFIKPGGFSGLKTESIALADFPVDLETNYNNDLLPVHEKILEHIENENCTGVILLYGPPGTGKTTYLRHLISITEKPVLYFSSKMAADLSNPDMLGL